MKKLLLFSLTLLFSLQGKAQLDTIYPLDAYFYATFFPSCIVEVLGDSATAQPGDTVIIDSQCSDFDQITRLDSTYFSDFYASIRAFQGMEYFDNCTSIISNLYHMVLGIESLPPNLDTLIIPMSASSQGSDFFSFSAFPPTLTYLQIVDNSTLQQWPALPEGLNTLIYNECAGHPDSYPSTLEHLECYHMTSYGPGVDSLPALPAGLKYLNCARNEFDLHYLPPQLEVLICGTNYNPNFDSIPPLPPSLRHLDISNPSLGSTIEYLPPLHEGLEYLNLNYGYNGLAPLPELPSTLRSLHCSSIYSITELPELPLGLDTLYCAGCDNLLCLPYLPYSLEYLNYNGSVNCIPNIPNSLFYGEPMCTGIDGCPFDPLITGTSFYDANNNCIQDAGEMPLAHRVIESSFGTYALTDTNGNYNLFTDVGTWQVNQQVPNPVWDFSCPSVPHTVTVDTLFQNINSIDFPNAAPQACHWLTVDIGNFGHTPCFTGSYQITYCNQGAAPAYNAYIDLELPEEIIALSSSPEGQDMGNGLYRIQIGDIPVGGCGHVTVADSVSCNAPVGLVSCARAEIFPTSPCFQPDPSWDQAIVNVDGWCNWNDTIRFTIENEGIGDMAAPSNYRIYQNNMLYQADTPFQLNSGESMQVWVIADGNTYRCEADQSPGHPGTSLPRETVQGCGSTSNWIESIFSAQDDMDHHIEIDCTELTASYDPNDKRVVPNGIGPQHIVHPNDSLLEYMIRFQNTGTDTAHNITIRDTLDVNTLDPLTFVSGASSHTYDVTMEGHGIVTWHFNDIMLPDSNVNEPASNGFVKFHIETRPDLPNGTLVNNSAAIYFDYNDPIITNTAFITIDDMQILVGVEARNQLQQLDVYPNPAKNIATVKWNEAIDNGSIQIRDASGRIVRTETVKGLFHELSGLELPQGFYTIQLVEEGRLLGTSKLSVLGL